MTTSSRFFAADGAITSGRWVIVLTVALVLLFAPGVLHACAVCYGDPNDEMAKGLNNGILVLLGVVGGVQAGFVALFWNLRKRARRAEERRENLRIIDGEPH